MLARLLNKYLPAFKAKETTIPVGRGDKFKLLLAAFYLSAQNKILLLFNKILFNNKRVDPKKILIFRTGSLGDSVCASPAIAAIRKYFPGASVTLLTNAGRNNLVNSKSVLSKNLYDEIIDYYGIATFQLFKLLRDNKYDLVIQLPQVNSGFRRLLRDLIFFRFIARSGWGWRVYTISLFKRLIEKHVFYFSESNRLLNLAYENGISRIETKFYLNITSGDEKLATEYFESNALSEKPLLAIAVGANSVKNRWPINFFSEVIHHFRIENNILLIGGPDDLDLVKPFNNIQGVFNCCGLFSPMQTAAILKKCVASLCNDSGPLHLSYAVGIPVVGLFASRDYYGKWFPPGNTPYKVLRSPEVPCSMCFFAKCDNNICMQAIKPREVIAAMEDLIKKR